MFDDLQIDRSFSRKLAWRRAGRLARISFWFLVILAYRVIPIARDCWRDAIYQAWLRSPNSSAKRTPYGD